MKQVNQNCCSIKWIDSVQGVRVSSVISGALAEKDGGSKSVFLCALNLLSVYPKLVLITLDWYFVNIYV